MKPEGKALDIVAVGLGQAGGNLAAEFGRRGYRAMALNTANTDLHTLSRSGLSVPEDQRVYIGIDGYDGAGSDLNYGRECISAHAGTIRERIGEHAAGADAVVVTAGLGGGTGSAVGELVRTLEDLSLPLIVLATLPFEHESGIAKVNAVRAVDQLVKEPLLGWIFVDNSRIAQAHGDTALDRYYEEINKLIIDPLDNLNQLNGREGVEAIRTLDGEDFRTLLLSSGILNFSSTDLNKLEVEETIQAIRDNAQYSNLMPEGFSLENVSYMGVIIEGSEEVLSKTPFSFFERVNEQLKDETGGGAVYMGIYRSANKSGASIRMICSSQSMPEGIQEMVTAAKREGGQLRDKLQQTLSGLDLGEIEEYELFRTSPGTSRRRVPEQPSGGRRPRPGSALREEGSEATRKTPTRAKAPPKEAPVASVTPPAGAQAADREAYDAMVKEFKESDSEEVRKRVSERLEADQRSENSLIRYYAVRAMTKLDTELFQNALQAATNDEDATVRAIATKALNR